MKKNYFLMTKMMILVLSFFILTGVAQGQLYINEFMASNDFSYPGPQGDYPDWIEIYNSGSEAVNLAGYYMSDDLTDTSAMFQIPATYPDSVTVPAGGYILFYANKGEASSVLNLNFKLSGGGEQIGLWDPDQLFLDSLTYTDQITDTSYGRFHDGTDHWYFMADITPGASNINPNPPPTVELFINEFMASNDFAFPGPQGDYPDWIEIYNPGTEAIMLGGYFLADDLVDPTAMYEIPDTYPDSVTVAAGGFIVFYANKGEASSVMNLDFKLSGGGEQVGLWNPGQHFLDSLTYTDQITDTSYGRYIDGTDNWYFMPDFTPGAANQHSSSINEVDENASVSQNYPNPFSGETKIEFSLETPDRVTIEIFNVSGALVSTLVSADYTRGTHTILWDASDMPAGFYFYTLQTSKSIITKKALIVR
ncbi:MAG: lamin tail domain-containing protein [Bacteroidota bacterium]